MGGLDLNNININNGLEEVSLEMIKHKITTNVKKYFGKKVEEADSKELYFAVVKTMQDYMAEKWLDSKEAYKKAQEKQVYYLSMEYLMGRMLGNNIINLGLLEVYDKALQDLGVEIDVIRDAENDAGLGNGGLGRLAACFLDSMATLSLPGYGYGMRYRYGFFMQKIVDGYQCEFPDMWLEDENVWDFKKADKSVQIKYGGEVKYVEKKEGGFTYRHENYYTVLAVPYDIPIVGYKNDTINTLRLWSAEAINKFDFQTFSKGNFMDALKEANHASHISLVLYPEDSHYEGKLLRLKQQYFFVSASIQDILRKFKNKHKDFSLLSEKVAIQLNDTHPTLAIPELMRVLIDEEKFSWDQAYDITTKTFAFTNHTILPEALEQWDVDLVKGLVPRVHQIIEEIDRRWNEKLNKIYPNDTNKKEALRIIKDGRLRMAYLSIVCSYSVNGVAKLHTEILKNSVFHDFYTLFPERFSNKTNGVTPRRWLYKANRPLSKVICETIGERWITDLTALQELESYANDTAFKKKVRDAKMLNKQALAAHIMETNHIKVNPKSIFVVQCKRIHEYKRQLLEGLYILDLYNRIKENPDNDIYPQTFIFAGKAAPNYYMAKLTIKFINNLANIINNDPIVSQKMKVVFLEDFRVSLAERLYPAADVSIQISTASKEASGTGNMKFMLNGALTLGTLDGANVEIAEAVGEDNIFIFGLTSEEVLHYYEKGGYHPHEVVSHNPSLEKVMTQLIDGTVSPDNPELFRDIYNSLLHQGGDYYFVLKDFEGLKNKHDEINRLYKNDNMWYNKAIINIARSGRFSSDHTIRQYAKEIWGIQEIVK